MQEYLIEFSKLPVDSFFHLKGKNTPVLMKHSTRTAKMLQNGRIFYMPMKELVVMDRRI